MVAIDNRSYAGSERAMRRADFRSDPIFAAASKAAAIFVLLILFGIIGSMVYGGMPAFREFGLDFLTTSEWDTQDDRYGGLSAIYGTVVTA